MENLKPCPFCGGVDLSIHGGDSWYWIECNTCGCEGPNDDGDNEQDAANNWNTRHRSWNLLMEWLDEIYPADIFDGSSGDIGPQMLVKLREINELRKMDK